MKAFLPFKWQPTWDVQSIKDVGWLCDGRTIFEGVQKILPGHYLVCRSFNTISQDRYWDVNYKDKVCTQLHHLGKLLTHQSEKLKHGLMRK
jgi:asparagine synthase (glutamine-hydrolysing)